MSADKIHLRQCILYYYQQGKNALETCRLLSKIFGDEVISQRTCKRWFKKFESGKFEVTDKSRSGRPSAIDDEIIRKMLIENPFLTTTEIAIRLGSSQQTISDHIRKLGMVYTNSKWVPREEFEDNFDKGAIKKYIASDIAEAKKKFSITSSKKPVKYTEKKSRVKQNKNDFIVKKEWGNEENESLEIVSVTGSASALWDVQHMKQVDEPNEYFNNSENNKSKPDFEYVNEKTCPECGAEFANEEEFELHECCMIGSSTQLENEEIDGHFEDSISLGSEYDESEMYSTEDQHEGGGPVRNHTKVKITPWKCIPCRLYFRSCIELRKHYSSITCYGKRVRAFECEFCFRQFVTFNDLIEHQIVHINIKIGLTVDDLICCNQCPLQFPDERRFKNHSLVHALKRKIPIKYTCSCCSQVFFQKDLYEKHLETHVVVDNSNDMLEDGVNSTHMSDGTNSEEPKKLCGAIRCFRCGQTFASVKQLEHHETTKHKNPTPFFCRKCGLRFSARSLLLMHLRVHMSKTNEQESPTPKEFVCNMCDSKFMLESDLDSHMKTHKGFHIKKFHILSPPLPEGEEPPNGIDMYAKYKCSLCPRLYVRANSCVRHGQQSHKGQKVVPLRLKRSVFVGRRTTFPAGGKIKHKCPKCPKYFYSINAYSSHAYRSHGIKVSNPPEEPLATETDEKMFDSGSSIKIEKQDQFETFEQSETEQYENTDKYEGSIPTESPKLEEPESKCPFCSKEIKPSYISLHIKKFHRGEVLDPSMIDKEMPTDSLTCRYCLKTCSTPHNRKLHESIHYPVKGLRNQCETCGQKFLEDAHYEDHVRTCKSIRCGKCNKIFFKYINLTQHSCNGTKHCEAHKCTVCLSAFTSLDLLQIHIKNFHDKKPEIDVSQPGTSKSDLRKLQREMWREESNKIICMVGEKFYCTYCDCEFLTVQESNEHRALHPRGNWYAVQISDSLFQCTICDKFFESRRSSLLHINHHKRNQMPEQAKQLPLSFEPEVEIFTDIRPPELVKHKKFNCRYCGSVFTDEEDLQEHLFQYHVNQA